MHIHQVGALLALARSQIARGEATSVVPFNAITLPFTLAEILQIARLHSEKTCKDVERVTLKPSQLAVGIGSPLRVGYLSADFRHIHPVGRDLAAILPKHTRRFGTVIVFFFVSHFKCDFVCAKYCKPWRRVKSFGYAINPPRVNDSSRETVVRDMGKFMRVDDMVDAQVISAITDDNLHVIIDLMGYTHGAKERVLSASPAPLIIAWKGFMGSSGSRHVSLVTTDPITSTPELAPFFSEKFLYVRPAFFVSGHATTHSNVLSDPPSTISRANAGLPLDAFVFGSFNTLYKIDPALWAVWMQILADVPNSVRALYLIFFTQRFVTLRL
jgi:predicted O-linked N-acetylglucosamine transferase (SPINDLY family)